MTQVKNKYLFIDQLKIGSVYSVKRKNSGTERLMFFIKFDNKFDRTNIYGLPLLFLGNTSEYGGKPVLLFISGGQKVFMPEDYLAVGTYTGQITIENLA